ncbi:Uncharacterised protein [Burkholderia pseudomallei]|nr:Uncharacterised protein [Burkholderia pseudomallei]
MNATIAAILTTENPYSTEPNTSTLSALTNTSTAEKPAIQTQPGTAGSQYFMYSATAVTSVPTASTMHAQYA